jgi:2,4-dienoyl-CoA reductase (NADPH2)
MNEWGIDKTLSARGGIEGCKPKISPSLREVYLLQRKTSKMGSALGKTTGWIHRAGLAKKHVKMINGCNYQRIDDNGLHMTIGDKPELLAVDNIIICAGQDPLIEITHGLKLPFHLIGGADSAKELDAKTAIAQGTKIAASL